jgi:hypothetical protein
MLVQVNAGCIHVLGRLQLPDSFRLADDPGLINCFFPLPLVSHEALSLTKTRAANRIETG